MKDREEFIKAYQDFKKSVDLTKGGVLPELDHLIGFMLMGVPRVPADEDPSPDAPMAAIDQRVSILKAVFVEVNGDQTEDFIDQGLALYDQAGHVAKVLLEQTTPAPDLDEG
jgi:hypothetical protein